MPYTFFAVILMIGLSNLEVEERLKIYGYKELKEKKKLLFKFKRMDYLFGEGIFNVYLYGNNKIIHEKEG